MLRIEGDFSFYPVPVDKDVLECYLNREYNRLSHLEYSVRVVQAEINAFRFYCDCNAVDSWDLFEYMNKNDVKIFWEDLEVLI